MNQVPRTIASIIAEAESKKTAKEQAEVLKANSSAALKAVIGHAMDPNVVWLLPEGNPPYKPLPNNADMELALHTQTRMFQYVTRPGGDQVAPLKREQIFIQILEGIDPADAELMLRVKNKKLKLKTEAVKIAFPGISSHWQ